MPGGDNAGMRFADLLLQLDPRTGGALLCGLAPQEALDAAAAHAHPDPVGGEILRLWRDWCPLTDAAATVERSALVNALGPLRRRAMADELSPEGFQLLNRVVEAIDAVFDEAVLQRGRRPLQG